MLASTSYNRHGAARLDTQKGYAGTPTIRNARSLLFPFLSPGAMKAASSVPVQGRSERQARDARVLQCPGVEEGSGRSPGLCHHPLTARHSTQVRDGRHALGRGAAFDLRCAVVRLTPRPQPHKGPEGKQPPILTYAGRTFLRQREAEALEHNLARTVREKPVERGLSLERYASVPTRTDIFLPRALRLVDPSSARRARSPAASTAQLVRLRARSASFP